MYPLRIFLTSGVCDIFCIQTHYLLTASLEQSEAKCEAHYKKPSVGRFSPRKCNISSKKKKTCDASLQFSNSNSTMLYTLQKKKITMLLAGGRECDKLVRGDMLPISVVEGKGL